MRQFSLAGFLVCGVILAVLGAAPAFSQEYFLGVSLPLSGDFAADGKNMLNGIQLQVDKINAENKSDTIRLVIKDDQNKPEIARQVAEEFVKNGKVLAVIGSYYSSTLNGGAMEIYDKANILVFSPYECNSDTAKASRWEFNMNYSDQRGAEFMAAYLKEILKKNNVLLVHNTDAFGMGSKEAFERKASRIQLNIHKTLFYDHEKKFGDDFISKNLAEEDIGKIDSVVIFSHTSSALKLVQQLRDRGVETVIFGPNTFASRRFLTDIDEKYTQDVYVASPFLYEIANEQAVTFFEKYETKYKEIPSTTAPMCADAVTLFSAAVKAKGSNRIAMRDYLQSLDWQSAIDGMTGSLYFKKDNAMDRDIYVTHIKDGRFKVAFTQLTEPREPYIIKQLPERLKKGYMMVIDDQPYQIVDVVFVGIDFVKITDIDPKTMAFEADTFIWYKWANEKIKVEDIDSINILNRSKKDSMPVKEDLGSPIKFKCIRVKAYYQIPFDLTRFPFDTQHLPIYIAHKSRNSTHLMLVMDRRHMDESPVTDITPQEWDYQTTKYSSMLYRYKSTLGDPDYRLGTGYKSKIYFSTVKANVIVSRQITPYLFNLFLPLLIILAIALLVVSIPVEQFVLRINVSMTALMSILVYYMAQKASLPKVGYLIKADYYFILAFLFILTIQIINVFVVNILVNKDHKPQAESLNRRFTLYFIMASVAAYLILTVFV